jgi:cyclic pyranopterin phosphate synthase
MGHGPWAMGNRKSEIGNRRSEIGDRRSTISQSAIGNRQSTMNKLTHVDSRGDVRMVDVSGKPVSAREAVARGRISISKAALRLIRAGGLKKGDPLQTARLAGVMAAKRTADLIPLCHPLSLTHADVTLTAVRDGYEIEARVRTTAQTGVEMEALTAVSVAALTIYDMVKAVDKAMVIGEIRLVEKRKTPIASETAGGS